MPTVSSIAYLDASALVKLVLDEDESSSLHRALGAWPRRVSSRLSIVEVLRAVRRWDRAAEPLAQNVLSRVSLLQLGDGVLVTAAQLDPPPIRALDAIHLASALSLGADLDAFVSYDVRQLEAATALGLRAVSPR